MEGQLIEPQKRSEKLARTIAFDSLRLDELVLHIPVFVLVLRQSPLPS